MAITDEDVREAEARMAARLRSPGRAVAARYDEARSEIVVSLDDGSDFAFSPEKAQGLRNAAQDKLRAIEISPTGLGLHWPELDTDLYVPALLEGIFGARGWDAESVRTEQVG